jgi:hypothetical protein
VSAASTELPLVGAPPVDSSFEPQEINIPRKIEVEHLINLAAQTMYTVKYLKVTNEIKSKQYQIRAFM